MLFNSYIFLFIYLPCTLLGFFWIGKKWGNRPAINFLFLASVVFYAFWNIIVLPLMLGSILINFLLGRWIQQTAGQKKKLLLLVGVSVNLGLLVYYKYAHFVLVSLADIFQLSWGIQAPPVLPLGISFYTFTQIAYLVDTWRGDVRQDDPSSYGLFVTFFPHLVAGPIIHHKKIIPQFHDPGFIALSYPNLARGLVFLVLGLAKKLLIADRLALWASPVFDNPLSLGVMESWVGAFSYTLQIYFDFSGYSDMAVGLALMLNVEIPFNFNSPYKATSLIDFWRRWHMSLSQFLRDYLYFPLGGNRHGEPRRYLNLLLTMVLGGFWHGAGFTFIFWGAWHGVGLALNHLWRKLANPLPRLIAWPITFLTVILGWVPFRAQTFGQALEIYKSLFGLKTDLPQTVPLIPDMSQAFTTIALLVAVTFFLPNSQELIGRFNPKFYWAFSLAALATICVISLNRVSEFLYFQF